MLKRDRRAYRQVVALAQAEGGRSPIVLSAMELGLSPEPDGTSPTKAGALPRHESRPE